MLRRGSGWCSKSLLSNRVPAGFKDSAATARLPPAPSFPIPHYLFHYSTISPTSLAIWLPEKRPNHCLDFAFTSCLIFKGASHRWMRLQRNTCSSFGFFGWLFCWWGCFDCLWKRKTGHLIRECISSMWRFLTSLECTLALSRCLKGGIQVYTSPPQGNNYNSSQDVKSTMLTSSRKTSTFTGAWLVSSCSIKRSKHVEKLFVSEWISSKQQWEWDHDEGPPSAPVVRVALGKHLCGTKPITEAFQGHFHTGRNTSGHLNN